MKANNLGGTRPHSSLLSRCSSTRTLAAFTAFFTSETGYRAKSVSLAAGLEAGELTKKTWLKHQGNATRLSTRPPRPKIQARLAIKLTGQGTNSAIKQRWTMHDARVTFHLPIKCQVGSISCIDQRAVLCEQIFQSPESGPLRKGGGK